MRINKWPRNNYKSPGGGETLSLVLEKRGYKKEADLIRKNHKCD